MFDITAGFEVPPDATRIWRYMDVGRFLALLENKALYFAGRQELEDPWEGEHPAALKEYFAEAYPPPQRSDALVEIIDSHIEKPVVQLLARKRTRICGDVEAIHKR